MALPKDWVLDATQHQQLESGQAFVYPVRRTNDPEGPLFALKRLKNEKRAARFEREIRTTELLRREHSVAAPEVVDQGVDAKGKPWFAMPWYGGGSLEAAVRDQRFRDDPLAGVPVLIGIAENLAKIHRADPPYAHRDLKPSNVFLDESGAPILGDFGLCLEVSEIDTRLTETDEAVGSRLYIAPENENGINPDIDQRPADAYAFGKMIWAVLSGRSPMAREHELLAITNQLAIQFNSRVFVPLDELIMDLTNADPRARLIDWDEVIAKLRTVEAHLRGIAVPPTNRLDGIVERLAAEHRIESTRQREAEEAERIERVRQHRLAEAAVPQSPGPWFWRVQLVMEEAATRVIDQARPRLAGVSEFMRLSVSGQHGGSDARMRALHPDQLPPEDRTIPGKDVYEIGVRVGMGPTGQTSRRFWGFGLHVWPSHDDGQMWLNRLPRGVEGFGETLPPSLEESIGPFPMFTQQTLDDADRYMMDTARLFVSMVDEYLSILDSEDHP